MMRDGYMRQEHESSMSDCKWRAIHGACHVHDVRDDLFHLGHVIVNFEFKPRLATQTAGDLNETLLVDYQNPSYDYIIKYKVAVGRKFECVKRRLIRGPCVPM